MICFTDLIIYCVIGIYQRMMVATFPSLIFAITVVEFIKNLPHKDKYQTVMYIYIRIFFLPWLISHCCLTRLRFLFSLCFPSIDSSRRFWKICDVPVQWIIRALIKYVCYAVRENENEFHKKHNYQIPHC